MSNGMKSAKSQRTMLSQARRAFVGHLFLIISAGALGLLFLLFSARVADADGKTPKLYALQNGGVVTSVAVGSTFEIQTPHLKTSGFHGADDIYLYANPISIAYVNPYSSQSISQAACISDNGGSMTCTWTYTNGGSPELYSGSWSFALVLVKPGISVTILEKTTLEVK